MNARSDTEQSPVSGAPADDEGRATTATERPAGPSPPGITKTGDSYLAVLLVLIGVTIGGAVGLVAVSSLLANAALGDVALWLFLVAMIVAGVTVAHRLRRRAVTAPLPGTGSGDNDQASAAGTTAEPPAESLGADGAHSSVIISEEGPTVTSLATEPDRAAPREPAPATPEGNGAALPPSSPPKTRKSIFRTSVRRIGQASQRWLGEISLLRRIRAGSGFFVLVLVLQTVSSTTFPGIPTRNGALLGILSSLLGAALAATAARYLAAVDESVLPEAQSLSRGATLTAWILGIGAVSVGAEWAGRYTVLKVLHYVLLALVALLAVELLRARDEYDAAGRPVFPVDFGLWTALGSRANIVSSLLDSGERQFGIDLRSTWALTVARRGLEPLLLSLVLLGWLSTSLTVIGVEEQGLIERLGVPSRGAPLAPGLHLHWPWPIDGIYRLPVRRVQSIGIGHEGEEPGGPENVLWSVEHAPNEFTLLLGNGRDLITIDANVQYRVVDPIAWRYHVGNPADALKAVAYRAVTRNTVNLTLSDALSENVTALTRRMRGMVQQDADSLGLGVSIVGFTLGGMHPPVDVARAYEAVVSAQIAKVTAVVNAQVMRNQLLPAAQSTVLVRANAAKAEGAVALAKAAGEAWSFRTLEAQYRASPAEYMFRRRLETLEQVLPSRSFTILDDRFLRDGGELWVTP